MRSIFGILLLGLFLISCKKDKEAGEIKYKVSYTSSMNKSLNKSKGEMNTLLHNGFGTYITSLTPYHFSASINMLGMQDNIDPGDNTTILLGLIMNNGNDMTVPKPQADFSNNQEVEFFPQMGHQVLPGQQINFIYFYFVPFYIYQEVTLPVEYQNITINQFNEVYPVGYFGIAEEKFNCNSVKSGNILKVKYQPFVTRLHPYPAGFPHGIVFGNTDSTFIFNKEGKLISTSIDNPFGGETRACNIRSNHFLAKSITIPEEGKTLTIHTTLSFDTKDIIQVYAGQDNIPYTSDDIFVYAPKYWERIATKIETY